MVIVHHMLISSVGFWYVNLTVESQSRESLMDSVDDSIVLIDPEPKPEIVYKNEAATKMMEDSNGITVNLDDSVRYFDKQ